MEEAANDEPSGLALSPQNQWLSVLRDAEPADSLVTAKAVTLKLHFTITTGPAVETQGWSQRAIASRLETYGIDCGKVDSRRLDPQAGTPRGVDQNGYARRSH